MNLLFLLSVAELKLKFVPPWARFESDNKEQREQPFFFHPTNWGSEEGKEEGGEKKEEKKKENQYLTNIYNNFTSGILIMRISHIQNLYGTWIYMEHEYKEPQEK